MGVLSYSVIDAYHVYIKSEYLQVLQVIASIYRTLYKYYKQLHILQNITTVISNYEILKLFKH